jgi:hypothetical protein
MQPPGAHAYGHMMAGHMAGMPLMHPPGLMAQAGMAPVMVPAMTMPGESCLQVVLRWVCVRCKVHGLLSVQYHAGVGTEMPDQGWPCSMFER